MAITPEQIDLWLQAPKENERLEFKEAKAQFDTRKLYEYCVALANEGGGHLLLGVTNKRPRKVVGTEAFRDPAGIVQKILQVLGFRVDVEEVDHPEGRVLTFTIPSRPRGTAFECDGKYLMRSGESLVPMSEDRLRQIFSEGGPSWLEGHAVDGLDAAGVIDVLDTQTLFELLGLPYPTEQRGVIDKLVHIPSQPGHPFQSKAATHSEAKRPPFPS